MLTIVVPCKKSEMSEEWYKQIKHPLIIIERPDLSLSMARKLGISQVKTKYVLTLDSDTILPEGYIERALKILERNKDIIVIAIDYEMLQGHLAFGISIWKTDILKKIYDWDIKDKDCECIHMWEKVRAIGYRIETLPLYAKHLRTKH